MNNKNRNMKYIIYRIETPHLYVKYINSDGSATLTNNESEAMLFNSEVEADAIIETIGGSNFWGTRPQRPHGK